MITLICQQCGNKFKVLKTRKNKAKFCSAKCMGKYKSINNIGKKAGGWKGGDIILICKHCEKKYEVPQSRKDKSKFCSKKCSNKWKSENLVGENNPMWNGGLVTKVCEICGKEYKVKSTDIGKFCSYECYGKYQSIYRTGKNSPSWKGGLSFKPYCIKFNESLKIQIREQYNNCDYISGLHKDIYNIINNKVRNLDVHHIDYDKEQGCNDKKFKLIPLSKSNHGKTNKNRSFWNQLFIYSLEYDKKYYSDNKVNIWEMI